jgi:hypothetical protein
MARPSPPVSVREGGGGGAGDASAGQLRGSWPPPARLSCLPSLSRAPPPAPCPLRPAASVASSTVAVDPPDIPEAVQLRQWWASLGGCTGRLLGRRLVCAFPFHPTPRTPHPGTTRAPLQV